MREEEGFKMGPSWKGVVKWGGFSLFLAGVILILFIIGQAAFRVTLPLEGTEVLENPFAPTALFVLSIVGEFLLFPGMLALYFALREDGRAKMLVGAALGTLSVVMFLASRGLIISLFSVSGSYKAAAAASEKAAYLAAAEVALETQNVYATLALIFLSLASILIGLVMLKGKTFRKPVGYIVILSGIFTIFTPFAVNLGIPIVISFIGLVLTLFWQFWVGLRLFKLGRAA
jgi:hypothetical protein